MEIDIKTELKSCPFCGGKAEMHHYGGSGRLIKCTSCLFQKRQMVIVKTLKWLEEKLIEDWNKRTTN